MPTTLRDQRESRPRSARLLLVVGALLGSSTCRSPTLVDSTGALTSSPPAAHAVPPPPPVSFTVSQGVLREDPSQQGRFYLQTPLGLRRFSLTAHGPSSLVLRVGEQRLAMEQPWLSPRLREGDNEFVFTLDSAVEGPKQYVINVQSGYTTSYIKASNAGAYDSFGSVALSGDGEALLVGAQREANSELGPVGHNFDNNDREDAGAAYLFRAHGGNWVQAAYLKRLTEWCDNFGKAVAISRNGQTLAFGMPESGISASHGERHYGVAFVYGYQTDSWLANASLRAPVPEDGDDFGATVALSGDGRTLAVGAPGEGLAGFGVGVPPEPQAGADPVEYGSSSRGHQDSGAVHVYVREGESFRPLVYLKAPHPFREAHFGEHVRLSHDGRVLAVAAFGDASGAHGVDGDAADTSAPGSGAVYVFVRRGEQWVQQAYLKGSGVRRFYGFGVDLALSADGKTLATTAAFERNLTDTGGERLNTAREDSAVYVFRHTEHGWLEEARLQAGFAVTKDLVAGGIALSGDGNVLAFVAAVQHGTSVVDLDVGSVYVMHRHSGKWEPGVRIAQPYPDIMDYYGATISLSEDGTVLAVGVARDDSAGTGMTADPSDNSMPGSGSVYVYRSLTADGPTPP